MNTATILEHPHFIINEKGNKESVVLSMQDYSRLLEELEDLAAVAERRNEETFTHSEVIAELKTDGYI
ncbi:MAG: hypothetical protein GXP32_00780 [Kiritimatiellaeota bacterium]|nr:hypothetical protein [Kiritimatiellota bacterium]